MQAGESDSVFDQIRSCAYFQVKESSLDRLPPRSETAIFRDPAGPEILRRIAFGLHQGGYGVDEPRPGKGCDAVLRWRPQIVVVLQVSERLNGIVYCRLVTFRSRPFIARLLGRSKETTTELTDEWVKFCLAIDKQLRESLQVDSVAWLTRKDAELMWSE